MNSLKMRKAALLIAVVVAVGLSFVVGLRVGGRSAPADAPTGGKAAATVWTCSMDPQVKLPAPGACPICGMDLIPLGGGSEDVGPGQLRLSERAAALAEIETAPVRRQVAARKLRLVGKVAFDEARVKRITARISGRLDRLFVDVTGIPVNKGEHLVEIYSPNLFVAQQDLLQALETERALDASASPLLRRSAERTVKSVREKLRLWGLNKNQIEAIERSEKASDRITITAPMGGVVVHKSKSVGDYVKVGEAIYTIADLSHVWVKLDAHESDVGWVRFGQAVQFTTQAYPGERFAGRVVFVDPVLTPRTRTVKLRLNVENPGGRLKPGMFIRAVLDARLDAAGHPVGPNLSGQWICPMHGEVVSPKPGACPVCGMPLVDAESLHGKRASGSDLPLVVPAPAVLWTGTRSLVYVRVPGPDPVFEGREIVLGPRAGGVYLVREGLEEGERVVTRGAFKIDASLQIQGQPSMMTLEPQPEPEPESRPESRPTSRPSDSEEKGARNPGTQEEEEKTSSVRGRLGPALDAYFGLHRDLAGDRASGGKRGPELAKALDKIEPGDVVADERADWTRLARALRATANAVGRAKTLKAQRKAFESVATALTELLHRFGYPDGRSVYRYHCPMAFKRGADWLQEVDKTENPYFGSRMFRCGKRVEALEAGGAK